MVKTIFGFRYVTGVPTCPCRDPGNYCSMEQPGDDPLVCLIRCWCGSSIQVTFKDMAEREQFIVAQEAA